MLGNLTLSTCYTLAGTVMASPIVSAVAIGGRIVRWIYPAKEAIPDHFPKELFIPIAQFLSLEELIHFTETNKRCRSIRFDAIQQIHLPHLTCYHSGERLNLSHIGTRISHLFMVSSKYIPDDRYFTQVATISLPPLDQTVIDELGQFISHYPNLQNLTINLGKGSIYVHLETALDTIVAKCPKLSSLTLTNTDTNQIVAIPASIYQLTQLEVLVLESLDIDTLPDFGVFTALKKLSLGFLAKVHDIPESIYQLTQLEELDLSMLGIDKLPDVGVFKALKKLYLGGQLGAVHHIPESIYQLTQLEELVLSMLVIDKFVDFGVFTALKKLCLSGLGQVHHIPESISHPGLEELIIGYSPVNVENFLNASCMPKLKRLRLVGFPALKDISQ